MWIDHELFRDVRRHANQAQNKLDHPRAGRNIHVTINASPEDIMLERHIDFLLGKKCRRLSGHEGMSPDVT